MNVNIFELPIQYTYLFGASLFLIPWTILFFCRRDLRSMLFQLGLLAIVLGLIAEYFWWTKDWWKPHTITNSTIGVEDVILSFTSAGVAATLYLIVFQKQFKSSKKVPMHRPLLFGLIVVASLILFTLLFQWGINSFIATLITFTVASAIFILLKPGLLIPAIVSGALITVMVVPIYLAMIFVTPTFVIETWIIDNMIGLYFLGVPIEDYVFYFVSGVLSFCAYPFYKDAELINLRRK